METVTPQAVNPQIEQRNSPSFFSKYKFTIISLCIIIVALIPLLILSKHAPTTPLNNQTASTSPTQTTPTPLPLTQLNAAPTIDAVSNQIQSALDQSNTDIQQASQVDTSQDSTTGL
jgi:hypothetical protein